MGYVIGCYAPRNHGKSTTIKSLCSELEAMSSSSFEVLYQKGKLDGEGDVLRAYRRYGILIYVISGGDDEHIVKNGYGALQYACGGLNCDLLVCATTQNDSRQTKRIREIEDRIEDIAKQNGHWMEWVDIEQYYDNEKKKVGVLRESFSEASKHLMQSERTRMHRF